MILEKILRDKKKEIESLKRRKPLKALRSEASSLPGKKPVFASALRKKTGMAVIAEIKRKSPSKGVLRRGFRPAALARGFQRSGATALSVLTDRKYFGGSLRILRRVRKATRLPLLRKDFLLDPYQIFESRLAGADAVLLIVAILSKKKLRDLSRLAGELGMDVLFEVHTAGDVRKIRRLHPKLVGINNRDLKTFRVDLKVTSALARKLPKGALLVSESGVRDREDLIELKKSGVKAVLVGESLMKQKNASAALQRLLGTFGGSR